MLRVLLSARSVPLYLATFAGLAALSFILGQSAIIIDFSSRATVNRLPYCELCGVVAGVLGVAILRPRLWTWDRLGGQHVALLASFTAALGIFTAPVLTAIGASRLPDGVDWAWSASNALALSAIAFALGPFLGAFLASTATLILYFGMAITNNIEPAIGVMFPVVAYPGPTGKWEIALILAITAVSIHFYTRGSTAWAHRIFAE